MKKPEKQRFDYPVVEFKCACCKKCWIFTKGPMAGRCLYGGPFSGFEKIDDDDPPIGTPAG